MIPETVRYTLTVESHSRLDYAEFLTGISHFDEERYNAFKTCFMSRRRRLMTGDTFVYFCITGPCGENWPRIHRFFAKCSPYVGRVTSGDNGGMPDFFIRVPMDRENWQQQYLALVAIFSRLVHWMNLYPDFNVETDRPFKRETFNLILGLGNPFSRSAQRNLAQKARSSARPVSSQAISEEGDATTPSQMNDPMEWCESRDGDDRSYEDDPDF